MYCSSIRVAEKRQTQLEIEFRMSCSQRTRQTFPIPVVVGRHDLRLQQAVEVLCVGPVLGALVGVLSRGRRWPSR